MKPKLLLKIASSLLLLHLLGHLMGTFAWKKSTEPVKEEVVRQMTVNKFPFMGADRSMANSMDGFCWAVSIALLFFALVLWLIAEEKPFPSNLSKKILTTISICLFCWSIDEFIFFFPLAALMSLFAAILSAWGLYGLQTAKTNN
jgi:hypothetical protein